MEVFTDRELLESADEACANHTVIDDPEIAVFNYTFVTLWICINLLLVLVFYPWYTIRRMQSVYLQKRNFFMNSLYAVGCVLTDIHMCRELVGRGNFPCVLLVIIPPCQLLFAVGTIMLREVNFYFRMKATQLLAENNVFLQKFLQFQQQGGEEITVEDLQKAKEFIDRGLGSDNNMKFYSPTPHTEKEKESSGKSGKSKKLVEINVLEKLNVVRTSFSENIPKLTNSSHKAMRNLLSGAMALKNRFIMKPETNTEKRVSEAKLQLSHADQENLVFTPTLKYKRYDFLASQRFIAILFLLFMINIIVQILYQFLNTSNGAENFFCYGCLLVSQNILYAQLAFIFLYFSVGLYFIWLIRFEPDPLLIGQELTVCIALGLFFLLWYISLVFSDPGHLYRDGKFHWETLILIDFTLRFVVIFPYQIYMSYKIEAMNEAVYRVSGYDASDEFDSLLKSKLGLSYFKTHLVEEMSLTNFLFFVEASTWKNLFDRSPPEVNLIGFLYIFNTYVRQDSRLQITVQGATYEFLSHIKTIVEAQFYGNEVNEDNTNEFKRDVFDKAIKEVKGVIVADSFMRFRRTQYYELWKKGEVTPSI